MTANNGLLKRMLQRAPRRMDRLESAPFNLVYGAPRVTEANTSPSRLSQQKSEHSVAEEGRYFHRRGSSRFRPTVKLDSAFTLKHADL